MSLKKSFQTFFFRLILILFGLTGVISCQKPDKTVLAKIDSFEVTEAHLIAAYKKYYYRTGQAIAPSYDVKSTILTSEFNTYVLATYAFDNGLHQSTEAISMQKKIQQKVLNEEYRDQIILKDLKVTEDEIRDLFFRVNTTLRASHLYALDKKTADSLYNLILQGSNFEELAMKTFKNAELAENGGDIGEFTVDEMDIAFEKTAFGMRVGEISKPVQTSQGYSIIKLTGKYQKPILTESDYAKKKGQLRALALKQKEELLIRDHLNNFVDNVTINADALSNLWQKISNNYNSFLSLENEVFSKLSESDQVLVNYNDFEFSLADFFDELSRTPLSVLNGIKKENDLKYLITGLFYRTYLYEMALEKQIDTQEKVKASINQTYYSYLAQEAEEHIKSQIQSTDKELLNVYRVETEKFIKPLEVNFSRIVVKDKENAQLIYKRLKRGENFEQLMSEFTTKSEEKMRSGVLGYTYIQSFGLFSEELSNLRIGEYSEPLFYQTGEYHIYKCLGRKEPYKLSFVEAKSLVEKYFIEKKFQSVRQQILDQVKKEHKAIINWDKLKTLKIEI